MECRQFHPALGLTWLWYRSQHAKSMPLGARMRSCTSSFEQNFVVSIRARARLPSVTLWCGGSHATSESFAPSTTFRMLVRNARCAGDWKAGQVSVTHRFFFTRVDMETGVCIQQLSPDTMASEAGQVVDGATYICWANPSWRHEFKPGPNKCGRRTEGPGAARLAE